MPTLFARAGDFIFRIPLKQLALLLCAILLVRTGIWDMGSLTDQVETALAPLAQRPAHMQWYYLWNYLQPALFHWLVMKPEPDAYPLAYTVYFVYCLIIEMIATFLVCALIIKRLPDHAARAALIIYFSIPISATAYFWVGMDGMAHLIMLLALVWPRNMVWALFCGTLLGLQHAEQGVVAYGALALSLFLAKPSVLPASPSREWALASFVGVLLGKAALYLWFIEHDMFLPNSRGLWMQHYQDYIIGYFLLHPFITLASLFGTGWLAVAHMLDFKGARRAFFIPLIGLTGLLLLAEDETRVIAMTSFPLVAAWMLFNEKFLEKLSREFIGLMGVLLIVIPWLWVWRGEPRFSAFPYDVAYILSTLLGWPQMDIRSLFTELFHFKPYLF